MSDSSSSLLIDSECLNARLGRYRTRFQIDARAECESTSTLLYQRAEQGAPSGSVVVTDRQCAGRGSRGRQWTARPEASLTFSLLWHFDGGIDRLSGLSLAVGVAVARALAACGAPGVSLKWPNDVLHDGSKLGGILVELQHDTPSSRAVIGIGLNLALPQGIDPRELALAPAALDQWVSPVPDRHDLLAALLVALADVLDLFSVEGFAALQAEWQSLNAWQDKPVRLYRDGVVVKEGVCRGADADGALIVQTANGVERCLSGDLSLRAS